MENAALDIMPGSYEIKNVDGIQLVDLGYATFKVPEKYDLAPHVDGASSVIALRVKDEKLEDVFLHPFRLEFEDFGEEFSGYFANRFDSPWDWQTEALYSQRFSFWSIFSRGRKELILESMNLLSKITSISDAQAVWLYESDDICARIFERKDWVNLEIHDKTQNITQGVMLDGSLDEKRDLVDSILKTIQYTEAELDFARPEDVTQSLGFPVFNPR